MLSIESTCKTSFYWDKKSIVKMMDRLIWMRMKHLSTVVLMHRKKPRLQALKTGEVQDLVIDVEGHDFHITRDLNQS